MYWPAPLDTGVGRYSLYCCDLAPGVTNAELLEFFRGSFAFVTGAEVRRRAGEAPYGVVNFASQSERDRAVDESQNAILGGRYLRVFPTNDIGQTAPEANILNTTIYVNGLDCTVNEEMLRRKFGRYGPVRSVRMPGDRTIAFVEFVEHASASRARKGMNGQIVGRCQLTCQWGKYLPNGGGAIGAPAPAPARALPPAPDVRSDWVSDVFCRMNPVAFSASYIAHWTPSFDCGLEALF